MPEVACCSLQVQRFRYGHVSVTIREGALQDGLGARVWAIAHTMCRWVTFKANSLPCLSEALEAMQSSGAIQCCLVPQPNLRCSLCIGAVGCRGGCNTACSLPHHNNLLSDATQSEGCHWDAPLRFLLLKAPGGSQPQLAAAGIQHSHPG